VVVAMMAPVPGVSFMASVRVHVKSAHKHAGKKTTLMAYQIYVQHCKKNIFL
jgi:hypothetical protein